MQLKKDQRGYRCSFGDGVLVQILTEGRDFRGLGDVRLRRRKLRSAELPILPHVSTPDGYEVVRLELEDVEKTSDCVTLSLTPYVARTGRMEWVSADGQDRWNIGPWAGKPERDRGGLLRISLRPVERTVGGIAFTGFAYDYRFRSRRYSIYRVHDRATWELGGRATGNSFWMQSPFTKPRVDIQNKDAAFSTAWRRSNVEVQQFLPLFSVLQGFTFQFDPERLLITAFERPFHCRSLFQKEPGQNVIVHWHQLCDSLSTCLEFPALQVLCADQTGDQIARADQYCAVRQDLQRQYREQTGVVPPATVVGGWVRCGEDAALRDLRRAVDELARGGCERVYLPGLLRYSRPDQAQAVLDRAGQIIQHAHRRGMEVGASLSECSDCRLPGEGLERSAPGELLADAMRRDEGWQALLEHLRRVRRELEVDALYAEPALAGSAGDFDWALDGEAPPTEPANGGRIVSLHHRRFELTAALQRLGFKCVLAGAGALGVPVQGLRGEPPHGEEFMLRDQLAKFPYQQIARAGRGAYEAYFRGCANRAGYAVVYDAGQRNEAHPWDERFIAVNKAFHAVREYMEQSSLLPQDHGILWTGPDPDVEVLWTFKEWEHPVAEDVQVFDVMSSTCVKPQDKQFTARPLRAYLLQRTDKA